MAMSGTMTIVELRTSVQKMSDISTSCIFMSWNPRPSICFSLVVAVHGRSSVDPQCLRPGSVPPAFDKPCALRNHIKIHQAGLVEVVMDGGRAQLKCKDQILRPAERTLKTLLPAALHRSGKCSLDLNCTEKRALQVR